MTELVEELEACLAVAEQAAVRFEGSRLDAAVSHMGRTMAALSQSEGTAQLDGTTLAALQTKLCAFRDLCKSLQHGLHQALLGAAQSTQNATYARLAPSDAKDHQGGKTTYPFVRRYG